MPKYYRAVVRGRNACASALQSANTKCWDGIFDSFCAKKPYVPKH
jgi:hypothetical protein